MSYRPEWNFSKNDLNNITNRYTALASGATIVHPKYFPKELTQVGVSKRDHTRNDFWGSILTMPDEDTLVYGLVYFDNKDSAENEDAYVLDFKTGTLEYFPKGTYEQENPLYKGTHRGLKSFLKPK